MPKTTSPTFPTVPAVKAEDALAARVPTLAEDFILALRYHYYIKARPLLPDPMYDEIEREWRERPDVDTFSTKVNLPGSDNPADYSDQVKALALYLAFSINQQK